MGGALSEFHQSVKEEAHSISVAAEEFEFNVGAALGFVDGLFYFIGGYC